MATKKSTSKASWGTVFAHVSSRYPQFSWLRLVNGIPPVMLARARNWSCLMYKGVVATGFAAMRHVRWLDNPHPDNNGSLLAEAEYHLMEYKRIMDLLHSRYKSRSKIYMRLVKSGEELARAERNNTHGND